MKQHQRSTRPVPVLSISILSVVVNSPWTVHSVILFPFIFLEGKSFLHIVDICKCALGSGLAMGVVKLTLKAGCWQHSH